MRAHSSLRPALVAGIAVLAAACAPSLRGAPEAPAPLPVPGSFAAGATSNNADSLPRDWRVFFDEPELVSLIDSALARNQELTILMQEIEIARNEARAARGEYLPSARGRVGAGTEKAGEFTRNGAVEHQLEVKPGTEFPEPLNDFTAAVDISWEVDIWGRLRKQSKAANLRYLASAEGRRFAVTHLVAEVARTYYELVALDQRLALIDQTITIQQDALQAVEMQKAAGRATELAVRRFEAEAQKNRSLRAETQQEITATQNRLNTLVGRYSQSVARSHRAFERSSLPQFAFGNPAQLLQQRPDIHRAELGLAASRLDVSAARARFYPALGIAGVLGSQSFELSSLVTMPASLIYGVAADVTVPIFNRRAIQAAYRSANARQQQALAEYERTLVTAFNEVSTQMSRIQNLDSAYVAKSGQVAAMTQSIELASQLFRSARAEYLEVLLVQREALEARIELVELRQRQLDARVTAYQALGWGADSK